MRHDRLLNAPQFKKSFPLFWTILYLNESKLELALTV